MRPYPEETMSDIAWHDLSDDAYILQLLKEFRFLTDEKKEQTNTQASSFAIGDETPESF